MTRLVLGEAPWIGRQNDTSNGVFADEFAGERDMPCRAVDVARGESFDDAFHGEVKLDASPWRCCWGLQNSVDELGRGEAAVLEVGNDR